MGLSLGVESFLGLGLEVTVSVLLDLLLDLVVAAGHGDLVGVSAGLEVGLSGGTVTLVEAGGAVSLVEAGGIVAAVGSVVGVVGSLSTGGVFVLVAVEHVLDLGAEADLLLLVAGAHFVTSGLHDVLGEGHASVLVVDGVHDGLGHEALLVNGDLVAQGLNRLGNRNSGDGVFAGHHVVTANNLGVEVLGSREGGLDLVAGVGEALLLRLAQPGLEFSDALLLDDGSASLDERLLLVELLVLELLVLELLVLETQILLVGEGLATDQGDRGGDGRGGHLDGVGLADLAGLVLDDIHLLNDSLLLDNGHLFDNVDLVDDRGLLDVLNDGHLLGHMSGGGHRFMAQLVELVLLDVVVNVGHCNKGG